MIIPRDKSPEEFFEHERLQVEAQREEVRSSVNFALSVIYGEHADAWRAHASQPTVKGAADVIDHAFLEANLDAQNQQVASDRAIDEAQRSVLEALDEFSA